MKNTFGADDKVIPIHVPANVIRWLEREGYDRAELVQGSGIDAQDIDSPEMLITLAQHHQLILNILNISNNPHIGLAFAKQVRYTNMGSVGWALVSSATLLESLQTFLKYQKLRSPLIQMKMHESGGNVHIVYSDSLDAVPIRQFYYEIMLGGMSGFFEMFGGNQLKPNPKYGPSEKVVIRVALPEFPLLQEHSFLAELDTDILFNQNITEVIFPARYLELKSSLADPVTAKMAREICDEQLRQVDPSEDLIARINHIVQDTTHSFPSLVEVAEKICVSPRTLRRELKKRDTTYQTLLDTAREKMAIKLLTSSTLTIHEISEKLGYKDPTNFGRAFRKWTGNPPGAYRTGGK